TAALPVKHSSRVRRADGWQGPEGLAAGFGRDAAHGEWFYGFRLALRTDLGARLVRRWGIVPAAVDERAVADGLLEGAAPAGLLLDCGFAGRAWAAAQAERGPHGVLPHPAPSAAGCPRRCAGPWRSLRNRIETTTGEISVRLGLDRHGAKTFWGLLTRTAGTILAHALTRLALV